tara:strand:- start:363 stop:2696 length:2334 start_codon:yes stop_codon:yes gene_type:complete
MSEENKKAYYQALKNAFADGVINNSEWQMLETLRTTLSISLEEHHQMESEIRNDNPIENNKATIKDSIINRSKVTNIAKVEITNKDSLNDILDNEKDLFKTEKEMQKALEASPIKDEVKTILELIDSKINRNNRDLQFDKELNSEEKEKGSSQKEFRDALEICEKNLEKYNNPYLWAIKGYCTSMLGNYDLGKEFIIKALQVAYNRKSKSEKYDKFRKYLFDNRNLLLAIGEDNKYLVKDIATLGRTSYSYRPINTTRLRITKAQKDEMADVGFEEEDFDGDYLSKDEFARSWYWKGRGNWQGLRKVNDETNLPRYTFIPKLKKGKVNNKGKIRTSFSEIAQKNYLPIQQFLEENGITQKESVNIFTEFKELYYIQPKNKENNIEELSRIHNNYDHSNFHGKKSGGSFLIFLKTICDEIMDVLSSQISDIKINDSELQEATMKIWKAQTKINDEKMERRKKLWESKPGFWGSYLTKGSADRHWEEKSYQNGWDDFLSDTAINITENWQENIEDIIENNSEKIIAYKHKINEIKVLQKAIVLFSQVPLYLETNKFRIFISNYEIMRKNLEIYENLSILEWDFVMKKYHLEHGEWNPETKKYDNVSSEEAKEIMHIHHKYGRNMIKETIPYFYCDFDSTWLGSALGSGSEAMNSYDNSYGFQIYQYEVSDIQDYTKTKSDFGFTSAEEDWNEEQYKEYTNKIFGYNDKKINTKIFSYDEFGFNKQIKFDNGNLIEVDPENVNLQLNFSWIHNGKLYPGANEIGSKDSKEFLELNKELLE